jgi:hypothetical protein
VPLPRHAPHISELRGGEILANLKLVAHGPAPTLAYLHGDRWDMRFSVLASLLVPLLLSLAGTALP